MRRRSFVVRWHLVEYSNDSVFPRQQILDTPPDGVALLDASYEAPPDASDFGPGTTVHIQVTQSGRATDGVIKVRSRYCHDQLDVHTVTDSDTTPRDRRQRRQP